VKLVRQTAALMWIIMIRMAMKYAFEVAGRGDM